MGDDNPYQSPKSENPLKSKGFRFSSFVMGFLLAMLLLLVGIAVLLATMWLAGAF